MTEQEEKTIKYLGILGCSTTDEVTANDLKISYNVLKERYKENQNALDKIEEAYNYLSDIKRTNETIRNINNPEIKTYQYQTERPEVIDLTEDEEKQKEPKQENNQNQDSSFIFNMNQEQKQVKVKDRPSILSMVLSLLVPFFGLLSFVFLKKILPKSAKWYLIIAIIGFILEFALEFYLIYRTY